MRHFVANLDCETEWAGGPPLPGPVRSMLAALGTLARGLGVDAVHLLGPVDPARVPDAGAPARLLEGAGASCPASGHEVWGAAAAWSPPADVAVARRANDRRLALDVATALGAAVGVAATSMAEVADAIADAVAASPEGAWVAKATLCAAGRDRVRRRGADLDDATRTRLARLLARGGALVVEPWLTRTLDLGQPGTVDAGGVALLPPHRLLCDERGGFRGVVVDDPAAAAYAADLAAAGRAAGAALAALGYRGRFVVDAFVHRGPRGPALRPVVEINARCTFGWVARGWADRLGPGALEVGRGAPPAGSTPLLLPDAADPTSAWFTGTRGR